VRQLPDRESVRGRVAAEVRAEMGRAKITTNQLPRLVGSSQSFWSRRVNAEVAFDVEDLSRLAMLLNVPITRFFATVASSGDGNVPPTGPLAQLAELRTFNPGSRDAKVLNFPTGGRRGTVKAVA
jgi:hypothetical protein